LLAHRAGNLERELEMLDATIYVESINLDIENLKSARRNSDEQQVVKSLTHFCQTLKYCGNHGLYLDANYDGGFTLKRNGYMPIALPIAIDGQNGFNARRLPNRRAMEYLHSGDDCYTDPLERNMYQWEEQPHTDPWGGYDTRYSDDPTYGQFSL